MLDRRSIVLADGSVRSYFALPPDYENFTHMPPPGLRPEFRGPHDFVLGRPPFPMSPEFLGPDARNHNPEYWHSGGPENSLKRKFAEDERGLRDDGFERQRRQLLQYGNANGPGPSSGYSMGRGEEMRAPKNMRFVEGNVGKLKHNEVDQDALKKAFLHFLKLVFETATQRKNYLADGKQGPLSCLVCGRFVDAYGQDYQSSHFLYKFSLLFAHLLRYIYFIYTLLCVFVCVCMCAYKLVHSLRVMSFWPASTEFLAVR